MFVQVVIVAVSGGLGRCSSTETLPLFWKTLGVGIAFAVGYLAGFVVNLLILRARLAGGLGMRSLAWHYLRTIVAAAVAGALGWLTRPGCCDRCSQTAGSACCSSAASASTVVAVAYVGHGQAAPPAARSTRCSRWSPAGSVGPLA